MVAVMASLMVGGRGNMDRVTASWDRLVRSGASHALLSYTTR